MERSVDRDPNCYLCLVTTPLSLDEIRTELAAIHEELLILDPDDFSRRVELHDRRNDLRALSAELAQQLPGPTRAVLLAAFDRLNRARDHILDTRMSPGSESVGDAGIPQHMTDAINAAIDAGMGLEEIEGQLRMVTNRLRRQ